MEIPVVPIPESLTCSSFVGFLGISMWDFNLCWLLHVPSSTAFSCHVLTNLKPASSVFSFYFSQFHRDPNWFPSLLKLKIWICKSRFHKLVSELWFLKLGVIFPLCFLFHMCFLLCLLCQFFCLTLYYYFIFLCLIYLSLSFFSELYLVSISFSLLFL